MSTIQAEYTTPTGQVIQVRLGDLTLEDTEAIVNAANAVAYRVRRSFKFCGRILYAILLFALLTGCFRAASHSQDLSPLSLAATASLTSASPMLPTPPPGLTQKSSPTASPTSSIPSPGAMQANTPTSIAASASAGLSQRTLAAFPLQVANSWVYTYQAYSGDEKASWQVVDTIVETRQSGQLYAARIEQEVNLVEGSPSNNFMDIPQAKTYWYVLDGAQVYRQDVLDWNSVMDSWLELVWPFPVQGCWYPEPGERSSAVVAQGRPGCRQASGSLTLQTLAGAIDHCYHLFTPYNNGAVIIDFCEQVGIVGGQFDHTGTPFGYHFNLTAYSLQNK